VEERIGTGAAEVAAPPAPRSIQPHALNSSFTLAPQAAPPPPNEVANVATGLRDTNSGAPTSAVEDLTAAAKDIAESVAARDLSGLPALDTTPTQLAEPAPATPAASIVATDALASLGLAALGLAPVSDTPTAPPAAPPTAWLALVAVRRQEQQAFLAEAPTTNVAPVNTSLVDHTQSVSLLTALAAPSADAVTASPTVIATIPVGIFPSDVAVSPDGSLVYVTNRDDNTVSVIDTDTNTTIGDPIPVGLAPSAVAVSPDGRVASQERCKRGLT
jgi:YVTN family beta-propeller protein